MVIPNVFYQGFCMGWSSESLGRTQLRTAYLILKRSEDLYSKIVSSVETRGSLNSLQEMFLRRPLSIIQKKIRVNTRWRGGLRPTFLRGKTGNS